MSWLSEYLLDPEHPTALAYHRYYYESGIVGRTNWMGYPIGKCGNDLLAYAEIIHETQPDVVIETGTNFGGSALFFAHCLDAIGKGKVLTIDPTVLPNRPQHSRINYINGPSLDPTILAVVRELVQGRRAMVSLDSRHDLVYVSAELELYAPFVQVGDYLVCEDGNLNGHPVAPHAGPGPFEAIAAFRLRFPEFVPDKTRERFGMSMNVSGWLRRER